jgi:hypothetical protein
MFIVVRRYTWRHNYLRMLVGRVTPCAPSWLASIGAHGVTRPTNQALYAIIYGGVYSTPSKLR